MTTSPKPQSTAPTFAALAKAIPALAELEREARAIRSYPGFCANEVWYRVGGDRPHLGGFKGAMSKLVGWEARGPAWVLTGEAYDVAYLHLYALLPGCHKVADRRNRCLCVVRWW